MHEESSPAGYALLDAGTRMASMRTTAAFQRTRMAADRTLMASVRTSLSMIGFGFTIFSFFRTLADEELLGNDLPARAPAIFGLALVSIGTLLLAIALVADVRFSRNLRAQRDGFLAEGLLRPDDPFPRSWAWLIAFLLLLVGLGAVLGIILNLGS